MTRPRLTAARAETAPIERSVPATGVTPVFVRASEAGWEVVDRSGKVFSTHDGVVEALEAARAGLGAVSRTNHLRDGGVDVGAFRWLDASGVESAAEFPSGHIDEQTIEELAAFINRAPMPAPIDGGSVPADLTPSPVHGTAIDSGTPANGWAHEGCPVRHADGVLHLYLRSELWPTIAAEFDRGRIAYGSVLIDAARVDETGAYRGARLLGHALTNNPANRRLIQSTAVRGGGIVLRASSTALRSNMKTKPTPAADKPKTETKPAETTPKEAARAGEMEVESEDGSMPPPATLEEAMAQIEQLSATVSALQAELAARSETPAEDPKKVEAEREKAAVEAVERALKEGRIRPEAREQWLKVARSDVGHFDKMTAGARVIPTKQTKGAPTEGTLRSFDPNDPYVKTMRAAGVSDAVIKRHLAKRTTEI